MIDQKHTKTFLFFGDSLIDRRSIVTIDPCYDLPAIGEAVRVLDHQKRGFFKLLLEMLQLAHPLNKIQFQSFARGGATSRHMVTQLEAYGEMTFKNSQVDTMKADAIFICIGTNDASYPFFGLLSNKDNNISTEEFKSNYEFVLTALSAQCQRIYCILPPPVRVDKKQNCINKQIAEYNNAVMDLKTLYDNVHLIDLYTRFDQTDVAFAGQNTQLKLRIDDGVHFSDLGNQLAANIIWNCLTYS